MRPVLGVVYGPQPRLSKGLGPENLASKRGRRIREGPNDGRIDVQPSFPLVRTLSSRLVFEIGGV